MFNFGFSYIGLLFLILLFVPNLFWTRNKPKDYEKYVKNENRDLVILERIGQVLVTVCALIFADFNIRRTIFVVILLLAMICMGLYEGWWIKYFNSRKTMKDFYSSFCGIPLAGATLPVVTFLLLGFYGTNIFMIISSILLGIGHIGIHMKHKEEVCGKNPRRHIAVRIIRGFFIAVLSLILLVVSAVIGMRNLNYFEHYKLITKGIDKGMYVELNGLNQYILVRGMDINNPVIIYLHGGPSSPDSYCNYIWEKGILDKYTVISWDQRGCGRTAVNSKDGLINTEDFGMAIADLDELVNYARELSGQDKIIIVGHSYGTILGSSYAKIHPEKVSCYVGAAQVLSLEETDEYSYKDAMIRANAKGDDTTDMILAYEKYVSEPTILNVINLRNYTMKYHIPKIADNATFYSVVSPYFGVDDLKWFFKQLGPMEQYISYNSNLFKYTQEFNIHAYSSVYEMPVYFISGSDDWVCPIGPIEEYVNHIVAPDKNMVIIEGVGHNLQYSDPKAFEEILLSCLERAGV